MKYLLKHITLIYIVLGLTMAPFGAYAANKKPRKSSAVASVKHKGNFQKQSKFKS